MDIDMGLFSVVTVATAAAGLWLAFFPRSYLKFAAKLSMLTRISVEDIQSGSIQLRTRVVGCLVLSLAAALASLLVHILRS
jgi:hypothetical protein